MEDEPIIGILGGMGPRATVMFENLLLDCIRGSDQDIPRIVSINDGSIPDRTEFLLGRGRNPNEKLVAASRWLATIRPTVVCLPCNTAHADEILYPLLDEVRLPVADMPKICVTGLEQDGVDRVLILGTEGTKIAKVYEKRASSINVIHVNNSDQAVINSVITMIKTGTRVGDIEMKHIIEMVKKSACDYVILACTELSFIYDRMQALSGIVVIDSMRELARFCVDICVNNKEKYYDTRQVYN